MIRRNTIQKELILNAVQAMHRHVTADEVYEYIRGNHPTISKGTVYRNLNNLAEQNEIRRVELPDGPDRFDFRLDQHYHVCCVSCGSIFDVDMDEISGLQNRIHDPHGILFLSYEILFKGICPACQKSSAKASRHPEN